MRKQEMRLAMRPSGSRGSALIVCLILVVLITMLVLGFAMTARMERQASAMHMRGQQARVLARMGVDVVAARIATATLDASKAWISAPGKIILTPTENDTEATPEVVELGSGSAAAVEADLSVDLNVTALLEPEGIVAPDTDILLPQRWIYVRRDGTHEQVEESVPAYNAENPVIGRYAYWADDDSSKINWNTAWTRQPLNTIPIGHPSRIALEAAASLEEEDLEEFHEFRSRRFFNSPLEPKSVLASPAIQELAQRAKLFFTHYNHSPDVNLFNEPRKVLTTNATLAAGRPYFGIVSADGGDPGIVGNLDSNATQALVNELLITFQRSDWPLLPGRSFVDKYGLETAAQIVLNIIDYVRSAESNEPLVEPLRGNLTGSTFTISSSGSFFSVGRKLLITEMGAYVPPTGADGQFHCRFKIEVYLPESAGTESCDLTQLFFYRNVKGTLDNPTAAVSVEEQITAAQVTGSPIMAPGERRVITVPIALGTNTRPKEIRIRAAIALAKGSRRLDLTPPASGTAPNEEYVFYTVDEEDVAEAEISSVAVDDPFINKLSANWKPGPNTFGAAPETPTSTLGGSSTAVPQQDTDGEGKIVNGVQMPRPGTAVYSVGELGFIHSGGQGEALPGVPWRTLRLQPRVATDQSLPDWALLDLFATPLQIPTPRERAVLQPHTDSLGGTINLNTALPFTQGTEAGEEGAITHRELPLVALLHNAAGNTITNARATTLAQNLIAKEPATGTNRGRTYGNAFFADERLYVLPGEIAEIDGFASEGEASEALLREVIGHLTTRGNVFSVFSIGQSIRHSPSGKVLVEGEFRSLSVVERTSEGVKIVFERKLGL